MAIRFLPPAVRFLAGLARWRVIRDLLVSASEKKAPGIWGGIACRKRYLDDMFAVDLREGVDSVVVLGAGLDTRAYRLAVPVGIRVFEVDLPGNIEDKRARIRVPDTVTLVPIDFETDDLETVLVEHGYRPAGATLFVWEGVTQYLTEDGVRKTFDVLAKAGHGSRLLFTYVRRDFLDGEAMYGADALHRQFVEKKRIWRFGLNPEDVSGFLDEYGWRELEQMGAEQLTSRYVRPTGRITDVSELERTVHAEKR
ncbi:O-methyltransferase [Amycolatopsis decaplanina DSM 44594]|uniref:S-adenosyl-L-methionine-dependent methyltransferase n=2 Tax=Amycolatopsis decaplanina TaxID=208441 RepID=M2WR63_9PSEU|nr:O-methyltransferase [Amycolatopsis decaplanina DSM 44594]